jgi:pyruvate dehydrogenase E2 component (dihydrolipoamide acetyltransferase)
VARREFRLPDLGEGLAEAEIVRWLVTEGDMIEVNQPLVEVETAKALVELPSPFAGRLLTTHGADGDTITVGTVLVSIDDEGAATTGVTPPAPKGVSAGGPATARPAPSPDVPATPAAGSEMPTRRGGEREPMLVGYGPRDAADGSGRGRRRRRFPATAPTAARQAAALAPGGALSGNGHGAAPPVTGRATHGPALAKPPVRRLARDLGVDLFRLAGTGPAGSISRADVEAAAHPGHAGIPEAAPTLGTAPAPSTTTPFAAPPTMTPPPTAPPPEPTPRSPADRERGGAVAPAVPAALTVGRIPPGTAFDETSRTWTIPVSGVRRVTARAMVTSAFSAPHVTEFVTVDVSETLAARDRLAALPEFTDVKVTPLLFAARAVLAAVRRHPMINASWVEDGVGDPRIVVAEGVNLGIAVASPRGLLVPNIRGADRLDLVALARSLQELTARTRAGQARPADLAGGTITITNIGVFGVDIGTPILNPGEAAILAVGAIRPAPWVHEGQLVVRDVCQLALSFDHRLVDGELGSVVLADIAAMLTNPTLLLAWS